MTYQPQHNPTNVPQHAYPVPAKKSRKGLWITLGVVVGGLVLCGGGAVALLGTTAAVVNEVDKEIKTSETSRLADVKITSCKKDSIGGVTIAYTVNNSAKESQYYDLDFDIMSGEVKVGDGFDFVEVAGGKTAKGETFATLAEDDAKKITCVLISA